MYNVTQCLNKGDDTCRNVCATEFVCSFSQVNCLMIIGTKHVSLSPTANCGSISLVSIQYGYCCVFWLATSIPLIGAKFYHWSQNSES